MERTTHRTRGKGITESCGREAALAHVGGPKVEVADIHGNPIPGPCIHTDIPLARLRYTLLDV